MVIIVSVSAA